MDYPKIWIKSAQVFDPALIGKAIVPRPGNPRQYFTEEPEQVDKTPEIIRMLLAGDVIEVAAPKKESK